MEVRHIEDVVRAWRGFRQEVSASDREVLQNLERNLKMVIFGQDPAIETLTSAIKMARSGLGHPGKPIGNFLFAGPTGVGKTEVTRQLAIVMGVEFLRFDMSQYMERHTVSRLIGAPPGYVGSTRAGWAFCVSLLAGQGSALGMVGAYILAGELRRAGRDYATAFGRYQERFEPFVRKKQKGALHFAGTFAPKSKASMFFRNQIMKLLTIPWIADLAVGRDLADNFTLPEY